MTTPPTSVPTRRAPTALYVDINITLPDRIAKQLPVAREGVPPHITLVHAQATPDQVRRLRGAFEDGAFSVSLSHLKPFPVRLEGTGDFRTATPSTPVVYVRVADDNGQLAGLSGALYAEYGLPRRFRRFCPHVTLAWRNREVDLDAGDAELDRFAAAFADFRAEFTAEDLAFTVAHGTILAPRIITWGTPFIYPLG